MFIATRSRKRQELFATKEQNTDGITINNCETEAVETPKYEQFQTTPGSLTCKTLNSILLNTYMRVYLRLGMNKMYRVIMLTVVPGNGSQIRVHFQGHPSACLDWDVEFSFMLANNAIEYMNCVRDGCVPPYGV